MKEEIKIDAKRLIAEVYKRSALWNQKDVLYHNRDVTNRIWVELSALLGLPKTVLKAKWKGLRDTFRAEIKKEHVYNKNKFPRSKSIWIHYKRLQFLTEQMIPRPPIWERENCNDHLHDEGEREIIPTTKNGQSTRRSGPHIGSVRILSGRKGVQSNTEETIINDNISCTPGSDSCKDKIKNGGKKLSKSKSSIKNNNANEDVADHTSTTTTTTTATTTATDTTKHTEMNNSDNSSLNEHVMIIVKHEPIEEIAENMEFENATSPESPNENETILQTVSPQQVLMTNTIGETCEAQLTVDPLESNRLDDNYYFLMSLLPHIKTLPAERRMLLRMQMQELVYKEVYKKNNCNDSLS